MGRIRTIKPEFPQSESIGSLSRDARLLFVQLWTIADDSGRLRGASRMLASLLYPYDDDAAGLMPSWLDELEAKEMTRRYTVDGHVYLEICNWLKHQKIDKPSESRFPSFDEGSRIFDESSRTIPVVPRTVDLGPSTEKPSRAKRERTSKDPTKTAIAEKRHADFKAIIARYWESKNPGVQMPWDGREGKHLEMFLRAAPDITADQFTGFLVNRHKSEVNHGERPSQWIQWITSYSAGPMDRFGKTIQPGGENGRPREAQPSPAKQRIDGARRVLAKIAIEHGLVNLSRFDGGIDATLPDPGPGGKH